MNGDLAYELHGLLSEGPKLYDTVLRANRDAEIMRLGGHGTCRHDPDFIGRAAVEPDVARPKRTARTLLWHPDIMLDIHAHCCVLATPTSY